MLEQSVVCVFNFSFPVHDDSKFFDPCVPFQVYWACSFDDSAIVLLFNDSYVNFICVLLLLEKLNDWLADFFDN
jgi:hypothetical protein